MAPHADTPIRALVVMPLATERGGSERQLKQLVEYRAEAGIELTIAFLKAGPMVGWCRQQGVRTVTIEAGRVRQARSFSRTVRSLASLARSEQVEIVVGWLAKGQLYAGAAAALARLPNAWLQPGLPLGFVPLDWLATLLPARLVVTVSRNVDVAQRRLRPRRPTMIVYPAVDTARFDARRVGEVRTVRDRLGLPAHAPIFGSVGRLDRWKGFHTLLAALPTIADRQPEATLVLVGGPHELDPAYAEELKEQAARLGYNGQVRLVGEQPNPEEWMQAMDVFVHASNNEPFGMVVIEAMALGKAVVASDEGGPTEVVTPGVDGLLCRPRDRHALARAIGDLLADDALRRRLGEAAAARAQDFTVHRFAREFGSALRTAASGRGGSRVEAR